MGKNDVASAASGSDEKSLSELISVQHVILSSAIRLINQLHRNMQQNAEKEQDVPGLVYNMDDLAKWVHYYTERRKLYCPKCENERAFKCCKCGHETEYHDEL